MDLQQFIADFNDADVGLSHNGNKVFSYLTREDLHLLPMQKGIDGMSWLNDTFFEKIEENIDFVAAYQNGAAGGEEWLALLKLKNGYWMWFCARCSYTGFDVMGYAGFYLHEDVDTLVRFGIDEAHRERLRLEIFMT